MTLLLFQKEKARKLSPAPVKSPFSPMTTQLQGATHPAIFLIDKVSWHGLLSAMTLNHC